MKHDNDNQNPWAGLSSYEDPAKSEQKLKFCGRDNETKEVARLIDDNFFVTLYGKSGIGKTSLLNAGVFPVLRREQYTPLSLRLGMTEETSSFQDVITHSIERSIDEVGGIVHIINVMDEQAKQDATDYLWRWFARRRFLSANGQITFPVLVFDQFEEVFRHKDSRRKTKVLLEQLNYLIDESHAVGDCVVDGEEYNYDFNFRFVLSIREDDLYRLEDVLDNCSLPALKHCRYRLRSLSEQGARDAIFIPGEGLFKEEEKKQIAQTIIGIARNKEDNSISTNLLSLVSSRLYVESQKTGSASISMSLVDSFVKGNPFERFYNEATRGFSNKEKTYIEEHLVDSTGRRNSIPESDFLINVKNGTKLIEGENRILQRVSTSSDGDNFRIELIHDSFCEPLEGQRQKRQQRRRIQLFMGGLMVAMCVIAVIWFYLHSLQNANTKMQENIQRFLAERVITMTDAGDSYSAKVLALKLLTDGRENSKLDLPETEAAFRHACSSNSAILRGHKAAITSVCYSSDNNFLLSSSYDNTIKLWNAHDGSLIRTFEGHKYRIEYVTFFPDGQWIISCGQDNVAIIWDVKTGKKIKTLQGHQDIINNVAVGNDGKFVFTASCDKTIRVWEVESGMCRRILSGHTDGVECVSISPDGNRILTASKDKTIKLWDWHDGKCLQTYNGHSGSVGYVSFSPQNNICVSTSTDKTVKVWNVSTGKCLKTFLGHSDIVYSGGFSPDGVYFASGSYDKTIRIWKVETGECIDILKGHSMYVCRPTFNSDGTCLVSGSVDTTIRIWDFKKSFNVETLNIIDNAIDFEFDSSGKKAVVLTDNNVQIYDLETRKSEKSFAIEGYSVGYGNFDNNIIISEFMSSVSSVWDVNTQNIVKNIARYESIPYLSFSRNRKRMATVKNESTIQVWDTQRWSLVKDINCSNILSYQVELNYDGSKLAYMLNDTSIAVVDLNNNTITRLKNKVRFTNYSFSIDSRYLLTCSWNDNNISKWDVETGICVDKWTGHTSKVYDLDVSPEGKYVVSVSHDGTIKFWDYNTGKCLITYNIVQYNFVKFSPKGDKVAMISLDDDKVTLLDFPPLQQLIDKTRERFKNRQQTPEERRKYYLE